MNESRIKQLIRKNRIVLNIAVPLYAIFVFISKLILGIKGIFRYHKDSILYAKRNIHANFNIKVLYLRPQLLDWYEKAGTINNYFWQDFWAAKHIFENNPKIHYDIGSRIDGFIGHLSSFRNNIVLIDIRPFDYNIPGVSFFQDDATDLKNIESGSVESISALCSLEHFGLGRYGDPIAPDACFKAMKSIRRVLKKGGHAYIAVPIGWEHVEFNAHRIFYAKTVVNSFAPLKLLEYSVATNFGIEYNVELSKYDNDKNNRGVKFGLFHFIKE